MSDRVYEMERMIFQEALERLDECPCENGCPSCVGASVGVQGKHTLHDLLIKILSSER